MIQVCDLILACEISNKFIRFEFITHIISFNNYVNYSYSMKWEVRLRYRYAILYLYVKN